MADTLSGRPWAQAPHEIVTADISAQALRVWLCICLHRRPDGKAPFPSQRRLSEMARCSVPTIKRAIAELVDAGLLLTRQKPGKDGQRWFNEYRLCVVPQPGITDDPRQGQPGITDDPRPGGSSLIPQEVEVEVEESSSSRTPPGRAARDAIWDALLEVIDGEPETRQEKSRRGKVVTDLIDAGATPHEIKVRARRYQMKWPSASLTDTALAAHWGELNGRQRRAAADVDCPECNEKVAPHELSEHRWRKHDVGKLCLDCGNPVMPEEEHRCRMAQS